LGHFDLYVFPHAIDKFIIVSLPLARWSA